MKKVLIIFYGLVVVVFLIGITSHSAVAQKGGKYAGCATIKDGLIVDTNGNPLALGYDQWGYNYQAHVFNGYYDNSSRPAIPVTEGDTWLQMKWNDAWLSNKDCDEDGLLDRHYDHASYIGSGAWLTNHQFGTYEMNGETCIWNYFVKIVAAPLDAVERWEFVLDEDGNPILDGDDNPILEWFWDDADGVEIGPKIWGAFAVIQRVYNDPCAGDHGIEYLSPVGPGFGHIK